MYLTLPETKHNLFMEAHKREIIELDNWHCLTWKACPHQLPLMRFIYLRKYIIASRLIRSGVE